MTTKTCKQCHIEKPLDKFQSLKNGRYHRNICYQCRDANYKEKNIEKLKKYYADWRKKNPINNKIKDANKRAKRYNVFSDNSIKLNTVRGLFQIQSGKCNYCGKPINENDFEMDHKTPLSRNGNNTIKNVHLVCAKCNQIKHDKTHEEFLSLKYR